MAESDVKERVGEAVSKGKRRVGLESPSAADADGKVGIVRGALKAFGQGDHDAFLDTLHEDVEWEAPTGENFPGHGGHRGRDAVRERFIEEAGRTYSEFGFHPDAFLDADDEDSVVVLGRFIGQGVEGDHLDVRAVQIWEFKGNTAVTVCTITDSGAFPEVVTEDRQKEWREEDSKKEREEAESEAKGDKDEPEAKSETDDSDDEKSERDDDSEHEERDD